MICRIPRETFAVKKKSLLCLMASLILALAFAGTGCGHKAPPKPPDTAAKKQSSQKSGKKDAGDVSTDSGDAKNNSSKRKESDNTDTTNHTVGRD